MKKLRTLSIKNADALNQRNDKAAWGQFFWRHTNLRKRDERRRRQERLQQERFLALLAAQGIQQVETGAVIEIATGDEFEASDAVAIENGVARRMVH